MGYWSDKVEESYALKLSFLRKKGLLKPNKWTQNYRVTFFINGEEDGNIKIEVCTFKNDEYVRLYYTITDYYTQEKTYIDYKVRLIEKPSNLGKGYRYYYECPHTKRLCTALIKPPMQEYFLHRTAFKVLYQNQTKSKSFRELDNVYYDIDEDLDEYREKTYAKRRKMIYKGKKTKHLAQFEKTYQEKENKKYGFMEVFLDKFNKKYPKERI